MKRERESESAAGGQRVAAVDYANVVVNDFAVSDN